MKRIGDRLLLALAPPVAAGLIRALYASMRIEVLGVETLEGFWSRGQRLIFTFWHDQLLLMAKCHPSQGAKILISSSKDGELIARTMERFGLGAVRGSSTRGGIRAFKALLDLAEGPWDLVITPDGPKGPRHRVKEGVAQLARLTGRPIVPLAFACSRGRRFASWDRFLLPYPFGRGVFVIGTAVHCRREEGNDDVQARLKAAMAESEQRARARLEFYGVSAV